VRYVPLSITNRTVLTAEEMERITAHAATRRYPSKAVVVAQGDTGCGLYVILEGRCKAYVTDESARVTDLTVMGPGEYFGEISLDEGPRSASVMTLEPSKLLVVEPGEFQAFLALSPEFAFHLIGKLIRRIRELTRSVGNLAQMDAYGRVARLLIESAVMQSGQLVVPMKPGPEDIAARVDSSPEVIGGILEDLVKGGYVVLEEERIVILRKPPGRW
jgi:CRP/FNR family cyclic AMP-dependent transcriptional regulator